LPINQISPKTLSLIKRFAPYGNANPKLVFVSKQVQAIYPKFLGTDGAHLKCSFADLNAPTHRVEAIGFGLSHKLSHYTSKQPLDVCYSIGENYWNGKTTLQLEIRDIKYPDTNT
jgi:single-stranded-DNA-specific exonuclease